MPRTVARSQEELGGHIIAAMCMSGASNTYLPTRDDVLGCRKQDHEGRGEQINNGAEKMMFSCSRGEEEKKRTVTVDVSAH